MKKNISKSLLCLAAGILLAGCVSNPTPASSRSEAASTSRVAASSSVETPVTSSSVAASSSAAPSSVTPVSTSSSSSSSSSGKSSSAPTTSSSTPVSSSSSSTSSSTPVSSSSTEPAKPTFEIAITNSEHLTVRTTNQWGEAKSAFAQGEKVIVKIDGVGEDYAVKSLEYGTKGKDSLEQMKYTSITDVDASGNYYFIMPYVPDGGAIALRVTERNLAVLKGYNLVGTYLGVVVSNSTEKDFNSFTEGAGTVIAGDGSYTYKNYKDLVIDKASAKEGDGTATFSTNSIAAIYYGDKIIYGSSYPGTEAAFASYDYIGIQKEKETDEDSAYTVAVESFKLAGKVYIAVQAWRDGEPYVSAFLDKNRKTAYFDVEFEFLYGEKVTDAELLYNVKKDGNTLFTISSDFEGGPKNRIVPTHPYGVYTTAIGKKLVLLGDGDTAYYDGVEFNLVIASDGVTLTLTAGNREVDGTIDETSKTFTVTKDEEAATDETPKFAGGTYRSGAFCPDYGPYYWQLIFSEDGTQVTSGAGWSAGSYNTFLNKVKSDVVYDAAAGTIKFTVAQFSETGKELTFNYDFFADKLTCVTSYSNIYDTKNVALTRFA